VLVDAPCTGSGTWRRRPDAKWRLTERQLEVRREEQATVLGEAARYVKAGGWLAYVTCSVFAGENADRVSGFLERHPAFAPADHGELWAGLFPGHPGAATVVSDAGIALTPARSGTDGFYFSALRRHA
jgi:16S rRNA (cytosine967-C5)-methyltransferase